MVVLVFYKVAECAVNGIVLAGLDFDRNGGKAVVIVDEIVHLAFIAVIIIKQLMTVSTLLFLKAIKIKSKPTPSKMAKA